MFCCYFGLGLRDPKRNLLHAQVGLAAGALDEMLHVGEEGAEACNVLANWAWPCRPSEPRCRHGASEAMDATPKC